MTTKRKIYPTDDSVFKRLILIVNEVLVVVVFRSRNEQQIMVPQS